jgi:hypothetical protein
MLRAPPRPAARAHGQL